MTIDTSKNAGWRPFVLLAIYLALLMAGSARAGQGINATFSPTRALQQARWLAEGSTHPRHVIYTFVDANCPYCHKLWVALQAYHRDGLQVRNILVGVIAPSSMGKAAAVFEARDSAAAWRGNEERWGSRSDGGGGIAPLAQISAQDKDALMNNETLMQKFGIPGTPGLVYVDAHGTVHVISGVPGKTELDRIMRAAAVPPS